MNGVIELDKQQLDTIEENHLTSGLLKWHRQIIEARLVELGADKYDMLLPETHVLPLIIHPNEKLKGIIYGKYSQDNFNQSQKGRGALLATDRRVLLIDRLPLFTKCNEISYAVVSGISFSKVGITCTVVLHTRLGNINIRSFNPHLVHNFVEAIEDYIARNPLTDDI